MGRALSYCGDLVRRFDHDRYVAALFAPQARREALFALYAFDVEVRRIRRTVTEPLLGLVRLQWWRESLFGIYEGEPGAHPVLEPLAAAIHGTNLTRARWVRLLDARDRELGETPPASVEAYERHVEDTGGALVELAAECLGARGDLTMVAARHVGAARELLALIHAPPGRLPPVADCDALLAAEGVDPESVRRSQPSTALRTLAERICAAAAERLAIARALKLAVPAAARPALLPASAADAVLAGLRRGAYDPVASRAPGQMRWVVTAALLGRY